MDKKLRDNLRDTRNCLFASENNQLSFQRPLLLIMDRNFDLATPLHHTWTYQALIHDVLELKLNTVELLEDKNDASNILQKSDIKIKKLYDLASTDKFWNQQKGNPFPTVAEAIQEELEEYKKSENDLKSLKQTMV